MSISSACPPEEGLAVDRVTCTNGLYTGRSGQAPTTTAMWRGEAVVINLASSLKETQLKAGSSRGLGTAGREACQQLSPCRNSADVTGLL